MAYRFELDESPEAGLRRIASEQVARALAQLRGDQGGPETIHETRKALKRLRALFKLVRRGLDKPVYVREYAAVRAIGRQLSGARDIEVMEQTLAALAATSSEIVSAELGPLRRAIETQSKNVANTQGRADLIACAAGEIDAARRRYKKLRLGDDSFSLLAGGAARGLHKLRRQHDVAVSDGDDEAYHDWRKSAQLHWRHMRLLSAAWPELIGARIRIAKSLAEVLGHDHDLAVLANFVSGLSASRLKRRLRTALTDGICKRQAALRAEARAYGKLLIGEQPGRFAKRLESYHQARLAIDELEAPLCQFELTTGG